MASSTNTKKNTHQPNKNNESTTRPPSTEREKASLHGKQHSKTPTRSCRYCRPTRRMKRRTKTKTRRGVGDL